MVPLHHRRNLQCMGTVKWQSDLSQSVIGSQQLPVFEDVD